MLAAQAVAGGMAEASSRVGFEKMERGAPAPRDPTTGPTSSATPT